MLIRYIRRHVIQTIKITVKKVNMYVLFLVIDNFSKQIFTNNDCWPTEVAY